ncbi:MAG: RHS repeat-associated core domain-containing protein, partial [Fimbriimonadales bacterium]|nr:RHS repeat-associated core domain-containing protein [Fimbriimonadales bacterium]
TATNSFSYNAFGARVTKTDSSGTSTYARNGVSVVAPVLSDGSLTYTPGISSRDGTNSTWSHGDIKNSLRQTAESETTSATKHYDAFGNETSSTGTWHGPFQYGGNFGYQTDAHSGLKLLGHRYYDPSTGRFLSRDHGRFGSNWYIYGLNNPITLTDPNGLEPMVALLEDPWLDDGPAKIVYRGSHSDAWLNSAANFFAGWGDVLTFGGTGYVRKWLGVDGIVDRESRPYISGSTVGAGHGLAFGAAGGARLAGWTSKVGVHSAHHSFGKLGKLPHVQVTVWKPGVKGSDKHLRIPLPPIRLPRPSDRISPLPPPMEDCWNPNLPLPGIARLQEVAES